MRHGDFEGYDAFVDAVVRECGERACPDSMSVALGEAAEAMRDPSAVVAEFGVHRGQTLGVIARALAEVNPSAVVHGFDSFGGLPEKWRAGFEKGCFDVGGRAPEALSRIPNVRLHVGLFEDTLPAFREDVVGDLNVAFLHVDCDLYSSTTSIFRALADNLRDTVVQFDELLEYPGFRDHELKALWELLADRPRLSATVLARSGERVAVRLRLEDPAPGAVPAAEVVPAAEEVVPAPGAVPGILGSPYKAVDL